MNWLQLVLALLQLAPQVITVVGEVEQAIGAGKGEMKKALVMAPLIAADAPPPIQSAVSKLVDLTVAAKNLSAPPKSV